MPSMSEADLNQLIATDPQIQQIIAQVWGATPVNQRPSDTPHNLEHANDTASKQIASLLASRGIQLPSHTFINPRSAAVEHQHGWAGLPTAAKIAIIASVAAGGVGAAGALGAFGGAAGAGSSAAGAGAAGIATPATTAGIAGSVLPGAAIGGGITGIATPATLAGLSALPGAAIGGGAVAPLASTSLAGIGAVPAGAAGHMIGGTTAGTGGSGILGTLGKLFLSKGTSNPQSYMDLAGNLGSVLGKQQAAAAQGRLAQGELNQGADRNQLALYSAAQNAQNQAGQLDLNRQAFTTSDRGTNAKQALVSQLLGNFTPTHVNVPGIHTADVQGGLARSISGNPGMLSTLSELAKQSNTALSTPKTFTGGGIITPPTLSQTPQVDNGGFLSTLANVAQLFGAANPTVAGTLARKPPPSAPYDYGGAE